MLSASKDIHQVSLTSLKKGHKAKIVAISAGKQAAQRLSALGLRKGAVIVKFSAFALNGPVTIKVGSTTLALGHGMAEKILVEPQI